MYECILSLISNYIGVYFIVACYYQKQIGVHIKLILKMYIMLKL